MRKQVWLIKTTQSTYAKGTGYTDDIAFADVFNDKQDAQIDIDRNGCTYERPVPARITIEEEA